MWFKSAHLINLITGHTAASTGTSTPARHNMYRTTWSAMTTSTTMATGVTIRTTAMSGTPTGSRRAGRPIVMAIGIGLLHGDTRGSMTLRGATRRSTTDAG